MPEPGPLKYAVIEVTNRCNLRCPHCASTSGKARDDELSLEEIRKLLDDIRQLGGEEITVIGGEMFIHDDWFEICSFVRERGMQLIIISNGILIRDEDTFAKLKQLEPKVIGISIDGATRESYRRSRGVDGFDHCLSVLRRLKEDGHPNVNGITTFMTSNIEEYSQFQDLFADTGITWQIQIANKGGERFHSGHFISRTQFRDLVSRMRDTIVDRPDVHLCHMDDFGYFPMDPALQFLHQEWHGCIAGLELIGIRSNGDLLGCLSLGDEFIEANIRTEPLASIWQNERYFSRFRKKEDLLTGACAKCAYARECRAGCTSIAYSATGNVGSNPYCIRSFEVEDALDF